MKLLLFCLLLLFSGKLLQAQKPQQPRCFFIGYASIGKDGQFYMGVFDTCTVNYPNRVAFKQLLESRFQLTNVTIISVSIYTQADRQRFWWVDTVNHAAHVHIKRHP